MNRNPDETFIGYCQRLTEAVKRKEITYNEWAKGIVGDTNYGEESLRRASVIFGQFLDRWMQEGMENISDAEVLRQIELQRKELLKERKKLQTENTEYQANLRNEARGEMFNDKILDAIELLPKFKVDAIYECTESKKTGVLCIADAHYGSVIELKSLFGEVVNQYNPDIFKERMNKLLTKIVNDRLKFGYTDMIVFDCGDAIENILRTSSLTKLKSGMIDSALEYAEFMATWLVALQNKLRIPIKYSAAGGNHDLARILSSKKDFPEENMMKVIVEFVRLRLKDIDTITVAPYGDCQFETIQNTNVLMYHGDDSKSDAEEMAFWEDYHDIDIDVLIMGHKHHKETQGVGYGMYGDKEVVHVNSLVGADTYSKKLRKISKAGAEFLVFEFGQGITWRTTYYLN